MPRGQKRDSKGRFAYQGMLSKQQLDCIAYMVYGNEQSPTKIAKEIGVSRASIYNWLTYPVFLEELKKQKLAYTNAMGTKALKVIEDLMTCKDKRTALKAALEVLRACGEFRQELEVNTNQEIIITLAGDEDMGVD
ncbi:phBC6A51 family helix-turn-helix protein [Cellulosilyticum sp. WCF-2]|uniref:phBC6A51 family helix-turn-helix protein n=1 Tax=Cellulosilyticum sp. WCF-2 TaxID=2497860 RepID=UPI000F8EE9C3|nr:phBC6A51 family helix-turn-helix protein [Cellulosilyticum sp. WCF-2]QEH70509.1 hypothetical protein EKH84_19725 [Cellulosilyticum sp. WCF-2]